MAALKLVARGLLTAILLVVGTFFFMIGSLDGSRLHYGEVSLPNGMVLFSYLCFGVLLAIAIAAFVRMTPIMRKISLAVIGFNIVGMMLISALA